jgi:hypothetical protein
MTPQASLNPIDALNRLNDIATAFCQSQTFFAACNLGVFDELHQGSSTAGDLAAKLKIHPNGCRRMLVALADMGLVDRANGLLVEKVLNEDYSSSTFTLMKDLTMLIACESGPRERTEVEYRGLLHEIGFRLDQLIRMDAPRDLVVARKVS